MKHQILMTRIERTYAYLTTYGMSLICIYFLTRLWPYINRPPAPKDFDTAGELAALHKDGSFGRVNSSLSVLHLG